MIKDVIKKAKNENGITGQDLIIAIFILTMFLTFLLTVYSNIKSLSYEIRMNAHAAETASKIAEKLNLLDYNDEFFKSDHENISSDELRDRYGVTGLNPEIYQVNIRMNQMKLGGEQLDYDFTKEIQIQVKYNLKGKFEKADASEIKLIKNREFVKIEDEIENLDEYTPVVAISSDEGTETELCNTLDNIIDSRKKFKTTTKENENWKNYSYFDDFLCCVSTIKESDSEVTQGNVLVWIPRYAIINNEIAFLYKDTNYPVIPIYAKGYNGKERISGYIVDRSKTLETNGFTTGEKGKWAGIMTGSNNYELYSQMIDALGSNRIYKGE